MFDSVGWPEILVLVVAGLFILGPERLPEAARWLGRTVNQVKGFATGAQTRIRSELGPEFDELAKPLGDLNRLRGMNPRRAVLDMLTRDDDVPAPPSARSTPPGGRAEQTPAAADPQVTGSGTAPAAARPVPFDPDAT